MATPVRGLAMLALLTVAGVVLFHPSFDAPFQFDDHHSIRENPNLRDLGRVPSFLADATAFSGESDRAMYRPLLLASYAVGWAISGEAQWAASLHLVNVLLHVAVSWLVWALVQYGVERSGNSTFAVLAGIGFLLHPVASETALYISARSESMSTLFMLASLLAWRRAQRPGSLLLFVLALGCKSTAIVTPVLLWGVDRILPTSSVRGESGLRPWGPFGVAVITYLVWMQHLIESSLIQQRVRSLLEQIAVQMDAWVYQLKLLLIPHPLSVIHPIDTVSPGWTQLLAFLMLLSAAALLVRRRLGWQLGVVLVPLIIPSVIPLHTVVSEHRLYPVLAIGFVVVGLEMSRREIDTLGPDILTRGQRAVTAVLFILWAGLAASQAGEWSTELGIWRKATALAPASGRAHEFHADALRRHGQPTAALAAYRTAGRLYGGRLELQLSIGGILLQENRLEEAESLMAALQSQYPTDPRVLYNLALARRPREPKAALELLEQVVSAKPRWKEAVMARALLLEELGHRDRAAEGLQTALRQTPGWIDGWVNLGFVAARSGRFAAARRAWLAADSLAPGLPMIQQNFAELTRIEAASSAHQAIPEVSEQLERGSRE